MVYVTTEDVFVERDGSGVELRTLDYENPGSNPVLQCKNLRWANIFTLHCSSSPSCINEYLAIASGGYVTISLRALIVAYGWMLPRKTEMLSE